MHHVFLKRNISVQCDIHIQMFFLEGEIRTNAISYLYIINNTRKATHYVKTSYSLFTPKFLTPHNFDVLILLDITHVLPPSTIFCCSDQRIELENNWRLLFE
jgi:hypothetical protein